MKVRVTPAEREPFDLDLQEGSIVVGRSSTADLALADLYASRHHARLVRRGESLQVEDLGSRNGTFLNDRPVLALVEVRPGDLIRIAGSSIRRPDDEALISDVMTRGVTSSATIGSTEVVRASAAALGESSDSIDLLSGGDALRNYAKRLKTLRGVHRAFSRATERADLLRTILDWAFDLFSPQQGAIYLRSPDGELRRAEGRPTDAIPLALPASMVEQVLDQGLAVSTRVESLQAVNSASSPPSFLIAAPMLDGDRSLGMLVLSTSEPARAVATERLDLLVELANEAALELRKMALVEEAAQSRLLEHELALARRIQLGILSGELPTFDGYSFLSRNIPSRGVSGDFYALTLRGDGEECVLFMGDVSGKGFSAALVTASVEALSAVMIQDGDGPGEICSKLSRQLFERTLPSGFVTAFVAVLDRRSGRLVHTNAGHNTALLARPDGSLEELRSIGLPLALRRDSVYGSRESVLEPGSTLLLYTDGISEAATATEEQYGLERLRACFARHCRAPLLDIIHAIEADLDEFVGEEPYADDRTVLMVRRSSSD